MQSKNGVQIFINKNDNCVAFIQPSDSINSINITTIFIAITAARVMNCVSTTFACIKTEKCAYSLL